jgi:2-desacetyl-2-hydroxyethyl bacteriochlorophyllide A dehydrogenase
MKELMQHVVYYGPGDVRVESVSVPHPGVGQVLVEVEVCAICGTDIHIIDGKYPVVSPPKDIGHEYAGTVVEIGEGVDSLRIGDRVVGGPVASCGQCYYCREGLENLCEAAISPTGGFAQFLTADTSLLYRLPSTIDFECGALTEPIACCLHGLSLSGLKPGDAVVVCGGGFIGLTLAQLAKVCGAGTVVLSELDQKRREIATLLGCDLVVDPRTQDLKEAVMEATRGHGADVAIDAVGARPTLESALDVAGRGASVVIFGCADPDDRVSISPYDIYLRELNVVGVMGQRYAMQNAIRMLSRLNLSPLLTHSFSISEFREAINVVRRREGIKVLIRPEKRQR